MYASVFYRNNKNLDYFLAIDCDASDRSTKILFIFDERNEHIDGL